ncbi:MAG: radical SAM family heme chaperone HemW [Bacteroidales bacterium]|nr:radical SAM family heme chaperone HemW [Bacteroidales bacterium]
MKEKSGLYVHIPFCKSKCVYCGFYSTVNQKNVDKYLSALEKEMALRKDEPAGKTFQTFYFGGGTPSLLQISQLQQIIDNLRQHFFIEDNAEMTIEANPEQLTLDYCKDLKQLGFNRISIGIQSFHDEILQFLGRKHTTKEALQAVENAHKAGFDNISIDLIYGVNERDNTLWLKELETAFAMPIRHFSAYALTVEENSLLYRRIQQHRDVEPDEDLASVQYTILSEMVDKSPFAQYEISNFAIKGWESKHNSAYWDRTPYLGLGPAAHSFDGTHRSWNAPTLAAYFTQIADRKPFFERETLTETDRYNEYLLLRLRTLKGIDLQEMTQLFGQKRTDALLLYFETDVDNRHYVRTSNHLYLTAEGLWFADGIAGDAFEIEEKRF